MAHAVLFTDAARPTPRLKLTLPVPLIHTLSAYSVRWQSSNDRVVSRVCVPQLSTKVGKSTERRGDLGSGLRLGIGVGLLGLKGLGQ